MRTMPVIAATCLLAFGCSNATQPFAFVPAKRLDPAPAVKADIEAKVPQWKTVVYANRRPSADVVFYGLADWRDASVAARARSEAAAPRTRLAALLARTAAPARIARIVAA